MIDNHHTNYNLGTLAFELERQLNLNTRLTDGQWTVTSDDRGRLTLSQSSPSFQSARLYSGADVRGKRPVPINWLFANVDGAGVYVANSTSWPQAWSAVDIQDALPVGGDACSIIGLPYRRLDFSPASNT